MKKIVLVFLCFIILSVGAVVSADGQPANQSNDQIITESTKAIANNPNDPVAYFSRGLAYHKKGQPELAIADFSRAIGLDPKYTSAYNLRGFDYAKTKQYDLAIADFNQAIALKPSYVRLTNDRTFTEDTEDIPVTTEHMSIPVKIDDKDCNLEVMVSRPSDGKPHPLIILTHGRVGARPERYPDQWASFWDINLLFAKKGYAAVTLVRRGYGNSSGPDAEGQYTRNNGYALGLEVAKDIDAIITYMKTQDYIVKDKIVVAGHSVGGLGTIAADSKNIEGVVGYINFAGFSVDVERNDLISACQKYGKTAKTPMLWLYSSGDQFLKWADVPAMNKAFQDAGGKSKLVFTQFVANGHGIIWRKADWIEPVNDFFDEIGFH